MEAIQSHTETGNETLARDRVTLAGISARGYHGVLAAERAEGQDFVVDLTLSLDTRAAAASDDLAHTVNYAHVADAVVSVLTGDPVNLIETVAERIAAVVLEQPAVFAVTVTVHKPQAPIAVPFGDVDVTITRSRVLPPVVARPFAPSAVAPVESLPGWEEPEPDPLPAALSPAALSPAVLSPAAPAASAPAEMPAVLTPAVDEVAFAPVAALPAWEEPVPVPNVALTEPVSASATESVSAFALAEPASPFAPVAEVVIAPEAAVATSVAGAAMPSWSEVFDGPDAPLASDTDAPSSVVFSPVNERVAEPVAALDYVAPERVPSDETDPEDADPAPITSVFAAVAPAVAATAEPIAQALPEEQISDSKVAEPGDLEFVSSESAEAGDLEIVSSEFSTSEFGTPDVADPDATTIAGFAPIAEEALAPVPEFAPIADPTAPEPGTEFAEPELIGNNDETQLLPVFVDLDEEPALDGAAQVEGAPQIIEPSPESLAIYQALRAQVLGEPEAQAPEQSVAIPDGDLMDRVPLAPAKVVLALGANLGDAQGTLQAAVADLAKIEGFEVDTIGPLARTGAVGGPDDQPDYLNTVVLGHTTLSARALLVQTQAIELAHGRERLEHWGPRTLDIDIIDYEGVIGHTADLELPHPRANQRAFVLVPWSIADPQAYLPGLGGGPVGTLADTAEDRETIRWVALEWLT